MHRRPTIALVCAVLLLAVSLSPHTVSAAPTHRVLAGNDIPTRLYTGGSYIFQRSDTLILNGRVLQRDRDYAYVSGSGYFDLTRLSVVGTDTLSVTYESVPQWLVATQGQASPPMAVSDGDVTVPATAPAVSTRSHGGDKLLIAGSKSFRFSAGAAGGSDFGQSLDLKVSGELSPGLELSGSVSDRGYDPAYGTANSRLNELDKISLLLQSRRLRAQVGDITLPASTYTVAKQVSGVSVDLTYSHWQTHAAVARPKGSYRSFRRYGNDGFQGPYQIGEGRDALPIVPGSEAVWLDGRQLERGTGKDYLMDYVTGRVTFTSRQPIDSRSRIEIDYEPQTTDYKKELFEFGGGAHAPDSLLYVSVAAVREGDDRNQPLLGQLSDADIVLLSASGDKSASRSGVLSDPAGAYLLVADSLPDSVFQYVGTGNGDYRIVFSFVGTGQGDYRFLGHDQYQYVGADAGDYRPVVILASAVRQDYYRVVTGSRSALAAVDLDIRAMREDRNLWSTYDDADNEKGYYAATAWHDWRWYGQLNEVRAEYRYRQAGYTDRTRLNAPDFERRFYLPSAFEALSDERLAGATTELAPIPQLRLTGSFRALEYQDEFASRRTDLAARYTPSPRLIAALSSGLVDAGAGSATGEREGEATTVTASLEAYPLSQLLVSAKLERDRRSNEYSTVLTGTRYHQAQLGLGFVPGLGLPETEYLTLQRLVEDTLIADWRCAAKRTRLMLGAAREFGGFGYEASATRQWLSLASGDETSFLGRAALRYRSGRNRLSVSSAYTLSQERRNARGITYLEVEPGAGTYILENGQYVPDPDGNYIQVEELLSDTSRVRTAEKSFVIDKQWSVVAARFQSEIKEELKESGERSLWWILPFIADPDQPYLFFSRQYAGTLRAFPVAGFYAVNLQASESQEQREIAGSERRRRDRTARLTLKQSLGPQVLEEAAEVFEYHRDSLYAGAGQIDGYQVSVAYRHRLGAGEAKIETRYRRAESEQGDRSALVAGELSTRLALTQSGELRTALELYDQTLETVARGATYSLTGNRPGSQGAVWQLAFNYGVKKDVRVSLSLTGRHSDDRVGRVTGRGEVVAGF